ncbi:MAG: NADPH-dependent FMN reductase [Desulfobacteraceae bacterium IS3]|nr:MAG: NADPH-dependent FMN reductase [Desulfobacteraceae bacterium IS3]HAO20454.1 NADPH-dependent FMN reductase [Desulfobacteraceae bacterium]
MNIVCLLGSPRPKGNSATIANRFLETAQGMGAKIQTFALNKLSYRGCQACMTCKTKLERCVLKDELEPVLDAVRDADILVMASPIYYGDVSAQLKAFVDRTFSYLTPDFKNDPIPCRLAPGKKLLMILAQGEPDEKQFADVFPKYEMFFKWYGFKDFRLIRACGVMDVKDAGNRNDLMTIAQDTAKQMMES